MFFLRKKTLRFIVELAAANVKIVRRPAFPNPQQNLSRLVMPMFHIDGADGGAS
jgi:hypothetical protein